jgi:hypothetical protein
MKQLFTLFAFFLGSSLFMQAQLLVGGGYNLSVPQGKMAQNMQPVHSFQLSGGYALPSTRGQVIIGAEIGIGTYAQLSKEQTFQFRDGSSTRTMVNYSSNMLNGSLTARFNLLRKGKLVPFVALRGGYHHFYSSIYVEDPADADGCRALERESILKDGSFSVGYGAGLRMDMGVFRQARALAGRHWLELAVNKTAGGNVEYINTRNIKDHYHNQPPVTTNDGKQPLVIRFINVGTQNIHEHQVAEVYTSALRLLDIRLSYVVQLGR